MGPVQARADGPPVGHETPSALGDVLVRLVVAPSAGVFVPCLTADDASRQVRVAPGTVIGRIVNTSATVEVVCQFDGWMMGFVAVAGERLRAGALVAWLRIAIDAD